MNKIIECVPNFSEGRDKNIINKIIKAIETIPEINILDIDMGSDTNRTVVTFVGSPEAVSNAAFQGVKNIKK